MEPSVAVITPSFRRDLDLCRMLNESVLRAFPSSVRHHIVVDSRDVKLFRGFEDSRTSVLDLYDVIPTRRVRRVAGWGKWTLLGYARPIPGWVVQQVAKLAFALRLEDDILIAADSDSFFLREVTADDLASDGRTILPFVANGIDQSLPKHVVWNDYARRVLGLPTTGYPVDDYISNVVPLDREVTRRACERVQHTTGRRWDIELIRSTNFSEFLLYGIYASELGADRVIRREGSACLSEWSHEEITAERFATLLDQRRDHHLAASISAHSATSVSRRETYIRSRVPLLAS